MNKSSCTIILLLFLILNSPSIAKSSQETQKPKIQHGITYQKVSDIKQYFVSEKLDGIRGFWDGKQFFTRQGNQINAPSWFTLNWPPFPLDGELWLARDKFQPLLSCVSKKKPEENPAISCWKDIKFMVFDLPEHKGTFQQRVAKMRALFKSHSSPYLAMIKQKQYLTMETVDDKLTEVIAAKGEGLMLHHSNAYYKAGRNSALMKLKQYQDDEAIVIGYTQGKGKYLGLLGALKVKTKENIIFKIGSGFSDHERANPPKIGATITYKYNGLTQAGIPRFARFWREKKTNIKQ